jgi:hypothetical protein
MGLIRTALREISLSDQYVSNFCGFERKILSKKPQRHAALDPPW